MKHKVTIRSLPTGVPGLDEILGGGIPEFSLNLILGPPGSGKTTLVHQLMFNLASPEQPVLFFSVLGESTLKMMRYQQQFSFFDINEMNGSVRFVDLNEEITTGKLSGVLARISKEVEASSPAFVFIDSFRALLLDAHQNSGGSIGEHEFIQKLAVKLNGFQCTAFIIGGYPTEAGSDRVSMIPDGLIALHQSVFRNSMVRQIRVLKMRGQPSSPGMHAFRITSAGIEVFATPAIPETPEDRGAYLARSRQRLTMGVPHLDQMMGGGLPAGYSLLVAGPSGSGKTILATAFLEEGVRREEPGVVVAFEQTPNHSWTRTIDDMARAGNIGLINARAADLSMDEIIQRLIALVDQWKAKRVVIDSLSGFELAVAPTFREDFRESLFRMVRVLAGLGVTVVMTSELEDRYTDLRFSPNGSAFLTDAIIVQRYIELNSELKRVMSVVKLRASAHSTAIREFKITDTGIVIGGTLEEYSGLLSGRPKRLLPAPSAK